MNSVELPFEDRFDELLEDAYENLTVAIPGWTDNRSSPAAVAIAENVRVVAILTALAKNVPLEILLDFWGQTQGVPRTAAAPATAKSTWTFTDTAGHTIDAGTEVELVDGDRRARFEVSAAVTVPAGNSTTAVGGVILTAVELGDEGNGYPAQTANLVDQVAAINTVTTIEPTGSGIDEESDETYQGRLAEELQVPGAPTLERDFAIRARSVAGVARAVAIKGIDPTVARNEVQTVTVSSATGGTFTLTFNGQTTAAIGFNATAAAVQSALEALSNISVGDVIASGGPLGTAAVSVQFTGAYRYTDVAQMTATSSLTGTGAAVAIATSQQGVSVATGQEGMVAVATVDVDGNPVAQPVKDAVDALLTDPQRRIVNVVVHVIDPSYMIVNVEFTAVAVQGYLPATVEAAAEQAVRDYLNPANWGATSSSRPEWENRRVVRYLEVAAVLDRVDGLDYITALTINGASGDLTMTGPAALPDPASTVNGTVTV